MAKEKQNKIQSQAGFRVQFNFLGLMIFSAALILAAGAISFALVRPTGKSAGSTSLSEEMQSDQPEDRPPAQVQPWGELMAYDTQLERPQEYMALGVATLPNFVVMAAADEAELVHMVHTCAMHDTGPIAVRYPRGAGTGIALPHTPERLEIGKGRVLREGRQVAILSLGTRLAEALKAADALEAKGLGTTVADLRFAKPLDEELIRKLLTSHEVCVTVEEGSIGGLGAHVLTLASDAGLIDAGLKLRTMRLPDMFQDQDKPELQYDAAGLNAAGIVDTVLAALRHNSAGLPEGARA